jgi:hypothetical protein
MKEQITIILAIRIAHKKPVKICLIERITTTSIRTAEAVAIK